MFNSMFLLSNHPIFSTPFICLKKISATSGHYNSVTWANKFIEEWTKDVMGHRGLPELKKFAKMIRSHQELILNYFRAKKEFSSGIVEGFNNKAKLTIRKSYGFRSDKLREIALYHTLGNLPVPEITHRFV